MEIRPVEKSCGKAGRPSSKRISSEARRQLFARPVLTQRRNGSRLSCAIGVAREAEPPRLRGLVESQRVSPTRSKRTGALATVREQRPGSYGPDDWGRS